MPQFVTIEEKAAQFNPVLEAIHLKHVKHVVIEEGKLVCDHLLRTSNVRTIWRIGPFTEVLPAHLPAGNVTPLTIRGAPPAGDAGMTGETHLVGGLAGEAVFNEPIDIFPGAFDDPVSSPTWVDTETQALVLQLESQTATDPEFEKFACRVFGRLIGETIAHEIVHSLLGTVPGPGGHNPPGSVANDLMNRGSERSFTQRTGFEDKAHTSPIDPANFIDHGIAAIGGLQAANQTRMNARFPVPPYFT